MERAIFRLEGAILKAFARDPAANIPLRLQVRDHLRAAILNGELPPASRLPSTRLLASAWGVSRNTVLAAYEDLAAEGLIRGKTGSGTRVRGRIPVPRLPDPRTILRAAHYPSAAVHFRDPEGNALYIHV